MCRSAAAEVHADNCVAYPLVWQIVHDKALGMVGKQAVDNTLSGYPLPKDEAVIVNCPGVLFAEVLHKLRRQKRVIKDRGRLAVYIRVRVQELLEPVLRRVWVACTVKVTVRTPQAAFEHLEHALGPSGYLVTVSVFDSHALDTRNMLSVVRTHDIALASEQPCGIIAADSPYKLLSPYFAHRLKDVPVRRALRVPEDNNCALAAQSHQPLWYHISIVKPRFARASSPRLYVPSVIAVVKECLLLVT